jgi:hypothetical protein
LLKATGKPPYPEEKPMILAALMGMGTNIGLTKIAEATPGISYRQMANVAQLRMDEDALNRAQATLVNFYHKMSLSSFWGDGSTSSSDGMRVQVGVSSLHADANPHYGSGKGATIYRFKLFLLAFSNRGKRFSSLTGALVNNRGAISVAFLHFQYSAIGRFSEIRKASFFMKRAIFLNKAF